MGVRERKRYKIPVKIVIVFSILSYVCALSYLYYQKNLIISLNSHTVFDSLSSVVVLIYVLFTFVIYYKPDFR